MEKRDVLRFRHGSRDFAVSRKAAKFASNFVLQCFEAVDDPLPIIEMTDLDEVEVECFSALVNTLDSEFESEMHSPNAFAKNVEHLVRPVQKYDCPFFWKRVCSCVRERPTLGAVQRIDDLTDVPMQEWFTNAVARLCFTHMQSTPQQRHGLSERLQNKTLMEIFRNGRFVVGEGREEVVFRLSACNDNESGTVLGTLNAHSRLTDP